MAFGFVAGVVALALASGLLIGCVGIGGVILVPALTYLGGIAIHTAIPAAVAAYLVSGAIGTFAYWRAGSVPWRQALPLALGAMPAALVGAVASASAPAGVIETCIGMLTVACGLNVWLERRTADMTARRDPSPRELALVGAVTGFASALTGTGGPLVLVPILMWLKCPVLGTIGMAQVVQLPIALLATAGNFWAGHIDVGLALALAVGLAAGTWGGAQIAHSLPQAALRRLMAVVLCATGAAMLMKVGARLLA